MPPSIPPTEKLPEREYFVPAKGYEFLFSHTPPGSLVVAATNERLPRTGWSYAQGKGSKEIGPVQSEGIFTKGLQLRIVNQQALPGCYDFNKWASVSEFKDLLLSDSRQEFSSLVEEEKTLACVSLQAALDATDSAA